LFVFIRIITVYESVVICTIVYEKIISYKVVYDIMTNQEFCLNCKNVTTYYLIYARIPTPRTKKNKWSRIEGKICSKCNAITLQTTHYRTAIKVNDGSISLLDKILIVPKNEDDYKKDEIERNGIRQQYE